jgi:hypothetical protein
LLSVRSASRRHFLSAACVASSIFSCAMFGIRAISFSIGEPTTLASFIVSDGLSSASFARRKEARSSCERGEAAIGVGSMANFEKVEKASGLGLEPFTVL